MSWRGRYFGDLEVGDAMETKARTVTEADVVNFCGVSGDFNSLHTDADAMRDSAFGQRVAHGALVLAIATGLRAQAGAFEGTLIAFAGIRSWRFELPVFIGDTIRVRNEIVELRETSKPDRGIVIQRVHVVRGRSAQGGDEIVQQGEVISMVRRRVA